MVWKKLNKRTWEKIGKKYEFIVTKYAKYISLDIFNTKIKDNDDACINSIECNTVTEAKKEASNIEKDNVYKIK